MERGKQQEAADLRYPNTPIGIVRSRDAFLRDLPALMANPKYDRWSVAYFGDERIGIAESATELFLECNRRGLHPDQYFIGTIFPHGEDDEEIETGFYEFEDIDDDDGASLEVPKPNP